MFIWNEERFAFNIMDAEMLKKFNDTSKEMWKELEEYEKKNATAGTIGPEGVAYESEVISKFFDKLFGNGASDKMFTSKHDLSERTKAVKKLYKIKNAQLSTHDKTLNDIAEMLGAE